MRAGLDKDMWDTFQQAHPDRVTIQDPVGAFYSKWDTDRPVIKSIEEFDYALFGSTLKRSKLVVAASFSTVIFDASRLVYLLLHLDSRLTKKTVTSSSQNTKNVLE
jgi:hypothetical protein